MRILHVFRAPVGGLFRHIRDLAKAQSQLGHEVGLICDASSGGANAEKLFDELKPHCSLGMQRIEMGRLPGLGDLLAANKVAKFAKQTGFDVLHGHGAKGGVYARLAASKAGAKAIYTAHGGTLHYSWKSISGAIFLSVEKLLLAKTAGLVFVCDYEKQTFNDKIGIGNTTTSVVHNGLWPQEFAPTQMSPSPSDILFVGELRLLKGVDVLLKAITEIDNVTATIVGDGPDRVTFENLANNNGLAKRVVFTGAMPASDAFGLGRLMVIPSRAESFPYIVLEAIAAHKPLIASNVGGIPEMLSIDCLVEPDDHLALAAKINTYLSDPIAGDKSAAQRAEQLKTHKSVHHMAEQILELYQRA